MLKIFALFAVLLPLAGSIITGLGGRNLSKKQCHIIACTFVGLSFFISFYMLSIMLANNSSQFEYAVYNWLTLGKLKLEVGFLLDRLTLLMMNVVTFVSFMVHIYTIGYMKDDPGYNRFFSYISLFTFAMLMLVMSNNLVQLFFGWEGVGLVSYLLIGFWFKKDTAIFANLKAFLVNRVGDFGFLLGIAGIFYYFDSFNYLNIFSQVSGVYAKNLTMSIIPGLDWSVLSVICICLFIGAMAKSAQVPLHVWLPDSMEGPTPISALIHAATMVTAGVFMVARMSPLFEYSQTARSFILVIGAVTALFMGLLGIVQSDIKRVVAYSTLSQLGYMVVALGVSAYSVAIFHLFTHAFFKALLFLGAGSVIIAMHHEQNIWKMGNLSKYMPITYWTSLIGSLALIGFPFFSGFYSKDLIIEAVAEANLPGAGFAYFAVLSGVFITALYSFRMFFVVFHTKERMSNEAKSHLQESPLVVWLPLVLLALPSFFIGAYLVNPMVFNPDGALFFRESIFVLNSNDVIGNHLAQHFETWYQFGFTAVMHLPFWLAISGVATAYLFYVVKPDWPGKIVNNAKFIYIVLMNNYGFDKFNENVIAKATTNISDVMANKVDMGFIDGKLVNGTAGLVGYVSSFAKRVQQGYLYNYTFIMIFGLLALIMLVVW